MILGQSNYRIEKVRFRVVGKLSPRGEPVEQEEDIATDHPDVLLTVWVDLGLRRRMEERGEGVDIDGVLEVRGYINQWLQSTYSNTLKVGDHVKFVGVSAWYDLTAVEDDSGIFGSVPMTRYNIIRSDKARRSS